VSARRHVQAFRLGEQGPDMIKELNEKRHRLHEENAALLAKAAKDGRDVLTADEEQEWQSRDAAIEALTKNIEMRAKTEAIEKRLAEVEERKTQPSVPGMPASVSTRLNRGKADFEMALRGWFIRGSDQPLTDGHREAAERLGLDLNNRSLTLNLSRRPPRNLSEVRDWEIEQRAQTITTTGGGYTIPDEAMMSLEKALLWFGSMRQAATIIRTESGADLPIPTANDTAQAGVILDINTQVANQDVTFGQLVLKAFKYSSKQVLVPVELMMDSAVNLPQMLGEMLGERIGRIQNTHFTTGAGTTLPFGITVQTTLGATGAAGGGIAYVDLVNLEHSVDIAYRRQGAAFMMNDLKVAALKKLLGTDGRPIWQPAAEASMAQGAPNTLLGYPVFTNNDMSTAVITGTKAVIFGALQKYLIREVVGVTLLRLDERYADFHQVAFLAFARADGNLLNAGTNPVKHLALTT
jgi:HK97 family phage major capsid protein